MPVNFHRLLRETRVPKLLLLSILVITLLPLDLGHARAQEAPVTPSVPASLAASVVATGPVLKLNQVVSQEPLLGGQVAYTVKITNTGAQPVTDRGYNLTISDTLPAGLTYLSASPIPTVASVQADGSTQLVWDNVVDLEAGESFEVSMVAALSSGLTVANQITNNAAARVNTAPDNSGVWQEVAGQLAGRPQTIDIEMTAVQSTALEQASGAGEYVAQVGRQPGADWTYQYAVTLRNNNVGPTQNVAARIMLPAGVAYLGRVTFANNPTGAPTSPSLVLLPDGGLSLAWTLGNLTTAQYAAPVSWTFDVAIPYKQRTAADKAAEAGSFAGPMSGAVIVEDTPLAAGYEAKATYATAPTGDGSESTPADDAPALVTAELLTVQKIASPSTVGIGGTVNFALNYYVSEYYTVTNGLLVDVLPDGMTYVDGSASIVPAVVAPNEPLTGQTTITWTLTATATLPGTIHAVTFQAHVDQAYEGAPLSGQPIVSGDRLTNQVTAAGDWQDAVDPTRLGTLTPDTARATVSTRMPAFDKKVLDPLTNQWTSTVNAFVGDTLKFRLTYASAADMDAKAIVIRDFLPRGMTYVEGSAMHSVAGTYTDGPGCTSSPQAPTTGTLSGLQYLEWRLCNATRGSTWQVEVQAKIGPVPNVQPGWLVANFGKLTGQNSYATAYSLRAMANINYKAPKLVLDKTVAPATNLRGGNVITYTIKVTNQGTATAYNLVVSDTLPVSLTVTNSGGTASPAEASYTTLAGNPSAAQGGVIQWSSVGTLAAGQTETYRYTAVIPQGLVAGTALSNIATVSYNSRADNQGHPVYGSNVLADDQTDDAIAYIKGMTVAKSAQQAYATIGDRVRWVITGTVPAGVNGFWPVVEENDLPAGFDYVAGSTVLNNIGYDAAQPINPRDNGDRDLRWYLNSIDNTGGAGDYIFTIQFDTLVTGVRGNATATQYYLNKASLEATKNTSYIGWYDKATGYNNTGHAYSAAYDTAHIDRRSPAATYTINIRQPNLNLQKSASSSFVGANEVLSYTLVLANTGNDTAYDMVLQDSLPAGLTFVTVDSMDVTYPAGWAVPAEPGRTHVTPAAVAGASYALAVDQLYAGSSVAIVYRARVAVGISADLVLTNRASVAQYSTKPGVPPDSNGDGLPDERSYAGPTADATVSTPAGALQKAVKPGELTYGATLIYRMVVPAQSINATLYNVVITDIVDSRLQVVSVDNGTNSGNQVSAAFAAIGPHQQKVVTITATLPPDSGAAPGTLVRNSAYVRYDNGGVKQSNEVTNRIVVPALTIDKTAAQIEVNTGDLVDYTIRVRNVGNGRAQQVQLTDSLPGGFSFVAGSGMLDGGPLADPAGSTWRLPDLVGSAEHVVTFQARADQAETGKLYTNTAAVHAANSYGQPIPSDSSARVPADTDPDDTAVALVYGPLVWEQDSTYVAFEDLKSAGWCDWDYNDFIVKINLAKGLTPAGNLAALKVNYEPIAHGGAFDHRFVHQLPVYGGGLYRLSVYDAGGRLASQTAGGIGDEPALTIFNHTKTAMPLPTNPSFDLKKYPFSNTMQVQAGTVQGYSAALQVVLAQAEANPTAALPPLPWDPYLFVYNTKQEVHLVQPGRLDNTQVVNNTYDPGNPMLGFDLPLANVFRDGWKWPQEFLGIWRVYPSYVDYATTSGFKAASWWDTTQAPVNLDFAWHATSNLLNAAGMLWSDATGSRYYAAPLIADLDGDGTQEIIVGNLVRWQLEVYNADGTLRPGWPQVLKAEVKAAAAVGDLDGDGKLEVVVGDTRGYLHAFRHDGQPLPGWPIKTGPADASYRILARPALADLTGDGRPEVILALSDGKLYVYGADGSLLPGWPVSIGDAADTYGNHVFDSSPVVTDLEGDGQLEIVVGAYDKHAYAYHANGTLDWTFATGDVVLATPAVGDIDPSRPGLETVIASGDRFVYLLDKDGQQIWKRPTGWIIRSSPLVTDIDHDGALEIVVGSDDHKVWAWHGDGSLVAGWPQTTGAAVASSPVAADVDGDGQDEIVVGSDDAKLYAWKADGSLVGGWPIDVDYPIKGAPAVGNMDGDAAVEVIGAGFDGRLKYSGMVPAVGAAHSVYLPIMKRP